MQQISKLIATGLYSGLLPKTPGTWGSLCCLGVWILLGGLSTWQTLLSCLAISTLGFFATHAFLRAQPELGEDPSCVVIDEWAGMLLTITPLGLSASPWHLFLAFVLFRTLDILKPWPIRRFEKFPGAWGIMLDDIVAGAIGAGLLAITLA